jgi:riboflavin synthase
MFTGLIEEVGMVRRLDRSQQGSRLSIAARRVLEGTKLGDSIAVSGACLTVVGLDAVGFTVECMPETLAHTTLGEARPGTMVNLERSVPVDGRLGGHLVLGHVDDVGEILEVRRTGIAWEVRISLPEALAGCVAPKGSIAVDGISLTVIEVTEAAFTVGIIPHTLQATTLGSARVGQRVNLEADVLARYVRQVLATLGGQAPSSVEQTRLTEDFLREQGFA